MRFQDYWPSRSLKARALFRPMPYMAVLALVAGTALAAPPMASIFKAIGSVVIQGAEGERVARESSGLNAGDSILTGSDSKVKFLVGNASVVMAGDSGLTLDDTNTLSLNETGVFPINDGESATLVIKAGPGSVEGSDTAFLVALIAQGDAVGLYVKPLDGSVKLNGAAGDMDVAVGEVARLRVDGPPAPVETVPEVVERIFNELLAAAEELAEREDDPLHEVSDGDPSPS